MESDSRGPERQLEGDVATESVDPEVDRNLEIAALGDLIRQRLGAFCEEYPTLGDVRGHFPDGPLDTDNA